MKKQNLKAIEVASALKQNVKELNESAIKKDILSALVKTINDNVEFEVWLADVKHDKESADFLRGFKEAVEVVRVGINNAFDIIYIQNDILR